MSILKMTDEEKNKILEKHKEATKNHYMKKENQSKGLQTPDKKTDK